MNLEAFLNLAPSDITQLMRAEGPKTCVFPMNGTRRWFMLEHAKMWQSAKTSYVDIITKRLIEICEMVFAHGIHTLVIPMLSPHIFVSRDEGYKKMALEGIANFARAQNILEFYETYNVRVRLYGDYEEYLRNTEYAYIETLFDNVSDKTFNHNKHRLFWGLCAHDATETTAKLAIDYYRQNNKIPKKRDLIEMYYGEYIPPVDLFITSSKLRAFDMPLISNGREDLYFTVAPSPYITQTQLKHIIYDHLFARKKEEINYGELSNQAWQELHQFYQLNRDKTLGIGARKQDLGTWYPLPQVNLPKGF